MAKAKIKNIEPLEMEFPDGTIKKALFNSEAFTIFKKEFGNIEEIAKQEAEVRPYDFVAKVVYCGMKVLDKSITLNEAKSIAFGGGVPLRDEINSLMINIRKTKIK
jgi:hypothetical protein